MLWRGFINIHGYWQWSCSVMTDSLWPHGLYSPWNSLGQDTGVGSLSLLQGDLPNPGTEPWSPGLLHCRQILYQLSHKGSPMVIDLHSLKTESLLLVFVSQITLLHNNTRCKTMLLPNYRKIYFLLHMLKNWQKIISFWCILCIDKWRKE